ncbi:Uncharacterised protein [Mycobacteroides abscessus subsp. abscessus]|nr:Uncharacterised protein [Mycobacteroides abscessus subsp. abscessus]
MEGSSSTRSVAVKSLSSSMWGRTSPRGKLSNTTSDEIGLPRSTADMMSASGTWWLPRRASCSRCSRVSVSPTVSDGSMRTRTGIVLMSMPIISSTPGTDGSLPETTVANTTSSQSFRSASTSAQASWMTVFSVAEDCVATSRSAADTSALRCARSGTAGVVGSTISMSVDASTSASAPTHGPTSRPREAIQRA